MTTSTLIVRSLRFHARAHLGALLGATVGSAVLIGALVVGDSVHDSLREMALARLGKVRVALAANDRFFRAELAVALAHKGLIDGTVVPAILLAATASTPDDSARANRIEVLGIDDRFWWMSEEQPSFTARKAQGIPNQFTFDTTGFGLRKVINYRQQLVAKRRPVSVGLPSGP